MGREAYHTGETDREDKRSTDWEAEGLSAAPGLASGGGLRAGAAAATPSPAQPGTAERGSASARDTGCVPSGGCGPCPKPSAAAREFPCGEGDRSSAPFYDGGIAMIVESAAAPRPPGLD